MPTFECPTCHCKLVCADRAEAPYRPFCSARCKMIDLDKWLNEEYRVIEELPDELLEELQEQEDPSDPQPPDDEE